MNQPEIPPIVNGKRGVWEQPRRYGFGESGYYDIRTFEGTKAEVVALATTISDGFFEVTELLGGRARVEWRVSSIQGQADIPVDLWEFFSHTTEKDLLECAFPFGTIGGAINYVSNDNKNIIAESLANPPSGGSDPKFLDLDSDPPDITSDTAISFYKLMRSGVRAFPVEVPILRHTQVVSNSWTVRAAFTNARRILATSTLISFEAVPSTILFNLPSDTTPIQFVEDTGDLQYGWRKGFPTVNQIAHQKWQIVQEWQYGLWAIKLHGPIL